MITVVDTSVIIDILRGLAAAVNYVERLEDVPACSEITRVEVIGGLRTAERAPAERLFQQLRWVAIDEPIARRAGEFGRAWRKAIRVSAVPTLSLRQLPSSWEPTSLRATSGTSRYFIGCTPRIRIKRSATPDLRRRGAGVVDPAGLEVDPAGIEPATSPQDKGGALLLERRQGGPGRDRTGYLRHAMAALYQVSYGPWRISRVAKRETAPPCGVV